MIAGPTTSRERLRHGSRRRPRDYASASDGERRQERGRLKPPHHRLPAPPTAACPRSRETTAREPRQRWIEAEAREENVVRAERFEIVDPRGRVRAVIGDVGGPSNYAPGVTLFDRHGTPAVLVGALSGGSEHDVRV